MSNSKVTLTELSRLLSILFFSLVKIHFPLLIIALNHSFMMKASNRQAVFSIYYSILFHYSPNYLRMNQCLLWVGNSLLTLDPVNTFPCYILQTVRCQKRTYDL